MSDTKCCIILTTTNDKDVVELIAKELINSNLAACVQVDEVKSYYQYNGQLNFDSEYRLMIKARCDNYDNIVKLIKRKHNYQLPQLIKLDINGGTPEYIKWLLGE